MPAGATGLPFRLLAVVLLLIPGVVAIELFYRLSRQRSSLSRLQWTVYSAFLSTVSLIALYILTPLYFDGMTTFTDSLATHFGAVTRSELVNTTNSDVVSLYILHFLLTSAFAGLAGYVVERRSDTERDRREPWEFGFSVVPANGEMIEVVTNDEEVIQGEFNEAAWDHSRRELYLDNPHRVEYEEDEIENRVPLGRSILLQSHAISRVIFTEEDPQRDLSHKLEQQMKALEEIKEIQETITELQYQGSLSDFEDNESEDKNG